MIERLGQGVDDQLQPLVNDLLGFLRDTKHLLIKLKDFTCNPIIIGLPCDVSSLYSSIPHSLGIQAVAFFSQKFRSVFTFITGVHFAES